MLRLPVVASLSLLPMSGLAATLTVGPSGAYATVDAAISAASAGDLITIEAGLYVEPTLDVDFDLTLEGAGQSLTTLFAAPFGGDFIRVNAGTLTVRSLQIDLDRSRGFLVIDANLTLDDVYAFDAFDLGSGGVIYADNGVVSVANSRLFNNEALGDGGHLRAVDCVVSLVDSIFQLGKASFGGGIYAEGGSLDISGSHFEDNQGVGALVDGGGGGVFADGTTLTVASSSFRTNVAGSTYFLGGGNAWGGAIYLVNGSALIQDVMFDTNRNIAAKIARGGGLAADNSTVQVFRSVFDGNWIKDPDDLGEGGAIWLRDSPLTLVDSAVMNSTSESTITATGGGIHAEGSDLAITGTHFALNSVVGPTANGGGIYVRGAGDSVLLSGGVFSGNASDGAGGGLYIANTAGTLAAVDVDTCAFDGNLAGGSGAGIFQDNGADLTVTESVLTGNSGSGSGGAIRWIGGAGSLVCSDTLFVGNSAVNGGGIDAAASGGLTLDGVRLDGNDATAIGGGLYVRGVGSLDVNGAVLCGNTAATGGGLSITAGGNGSIANTVFADSSSSGDGGGLWAEGLGGSLTLTNNTFVGAGASSGGGLYTNDSAISAVNTLIADTPSGNGWTAIAGLLSPANYTLFFSNSPADSSGVSLTNTVNGDPLLNGYSGTCGVDDYVPAGGSAAVNSGDPGILRPRSPGGLRPRRLSRRSRLR